MAVLKGLERGGAETLVALGACRRVNGAFDQRVGYLSVRHRSLVPDLERAGVPVVCLAPRSLLDPRWLLGLRRVMAEVDVVHAHSPVAAVAARLTSRTLPRRKRPALVTTEHNLWASHHRVTRFAERATFSLDDAHLAVSDAVRRSLPPRLAARVEVVIHGVDREAVLASADRAAARRDLEVTDRDVVVGTVANLRPQKGYPDLLQAARQVIDGTSRAVFVAIGTGPQQEEIADLHRRLGLGDRFRLLGQRDDAVRLLSGCDIFCLASHHEGLPVALMEALVLGIPVVSTRAGGIGELVTHGREGTLVPVGRPDLLAGALTALVADDPGRELMARHAAETGGSLSIDAALAHEDAVYLRLTGRPR